MTASRILCLRTSFIFNLLCLLPLNPAKRTGAITATASHNRKQSFRDAGYEHQKS